MGYANEGDFKRKPDHGHDKAVRPGLLGICDLVLYSGSGHGGYCAGHWTRNGKSVAENPRGSLGTGDAGGSGVFCAPRR